MPSRYSENRMTTESTDPVPRFGSPAPRLPVENTTYRHPKPPTAPRKIYKAFGRKVKVRAAGDT